MKIGRLLLENSKKQKINKLLKSNAAIANVEGDVIESFSVKFEDNVEIDLELINTEDGPYLNVVLFKNGVEQNCLDPIYEIEDEISINNGNEEFKVLITNS